MVTEKKGIIKRAMLCCGHELGRLDHFSRINGNIIFSLNKNATLFAVGAKKFRAYRVCVGLTYFHTFAL